MSGRGFWIAFLSVGLALVASGTAQDEKNEIGGIAGRIFISDQGIKGATYFDPTVHFGKGLTFEAEYGRRLWVTQPYSISAELPFAYDHRIKLNAASYPTSVVPTDMTAFFLTPAARFNLFPLTALSPWVSLGAGFGHFSQSNTLLFGGTNPGKSTTGFALEGGFGLDVKIVRKIWIRGEVRDFWSGEPDLPLAPTGKSRQHNYLVGGGAFWRF